MRRTLLVVLVLLVACSGSTVGTEPASNAAEPADDEHGSAHAHAPTVDDPGNAPAAEEADPPAAPAETASGAACTSDFECTIVVDHCGRHRGHRIGQPSPPENPRCTTARNRRAVPSCVDGECVSGEVRMEERRGCASVSECVVLRDVCNSWIAVNTRHRAAAEADIEHLATVVDCVSRELPPERSVACLASICVTRAP